MFRRSVCNAWKITDETRKQEKFSFHKVALVVCQNNFFIAKIVEILKLSEISINEGLCGTCPETERVKAKMFCFKCEQNLCERCGVTHNRIKLCQNR